MTSRYQLTVDMARRDNLTVRQLLLRLGGGRGHRTFTGTPEQVADSLEEWFTTGAADGFNVMPPVLPAGLDAFVEQVVPILQQRGLFRTAYTGTTLREHYGLPVPATGGGLREGARTAWSGLPGRRGLAEEPGVEERRQLLAGALLHER